MGVQWGKMVREWGQVEQAASEGFEFVHPVNDLVTNLREEELLRQIKTDRRQLERYLFYFNKGESGDFVPRTRLKFTKRELQQPGVVND